MAAGASCTRDRSLVLHNFKFGFEWDDNYNPYIETVNQGITALYTSGAPFEVTAYNTPFTTKSYFHDTSVYVQDATGYPLQPTAFLGGDTSPDPNDPNMSLTKLNQDAEQVILQPAGRVRLPNVDLLNIRLAISK